VALEHARERWGIPHATSSIGQLARDLRPEVAVIATPPEARLQVIEQLPDLRGVLVEKPLGLTPTDAQRFLDTCAERDILVQVNLWRRADETFRALAGGQLLEIIGKPQAAYGVYGNGLLNNGTHMVDLARMLFGEVEAARAGGDTAPCPAGPIHGDVHVPFTLTMDGGLPVAMLPIEFKNYRELSLDIWGERARLAIMNEGLSIFVYGRRENRAVQGQREIDFDQPRMLESTVGQALYHVYDNLAAAIRDDVPLWSSGESALDTARVIEAVSHAARRPGVAVAAS
jgi:predicted dehydrogenase